MAEESGKPEYLDPDEQEFHILIIAKDAFMLNRSAQFLTKRGWPTTVATSLQEAIQKAVTGKPDYIFVSVDHPSPKAARLPMVFTQTFNCTCVSFGEGSGALTRKKIKESKAAHKMDLSPSGPSMHRFIKKLFMEQQGYDENGQKKSSINADGSSNSISVKGSENTTVSDSQNRDDVVRLKGGSDDDDINFGADAGEDEYQQFGSSDSSTQATSTKGGGKDRQSGPGSAAEQARRQKQIKKTKRGPAYRPTADDEFDSDDSSNSLDEFELSQSRPDLYPKSKDDEFDGDLENSSEDEETNTVPEGWGEKSKNTKSAKAEGKKQRRRTNRRQKGLSELNSDELDEEYDENSVTQADISKAEEDLQAAIEALGQASRDETEDDEEYDEDGVEQKPLTANNAVRDEAPTDSDEDLEDEEEASGDFAWERKKQPISDEARKRAEEKMAQQAAARKKKKNQENEVGAGKGDFNSDEGENGQGKGLKDSNEIDLDLKKSMEENQLEPEPKNRKPQNRTDRRTRKAPPQPKANKESAVRKKKDHALADDAEINEAVLTGDQRNLYRAIRNAVKRACHPAGSDIQKVYQIDTCYAYPVSTKKESGILLVFSRDDLLAEFYRSFLKELTAQLITFDNSFQSAKPFKVELPKASYNQLKDQISLFTLKNQHQRFEVAFSYLDITVEMPTGLKVKHDMAQVPLQYFSPLAKTRFDSYLYLQKNEKFYKYMSEGRRILERQLESLDHQNVKGLQISESDLSELDEYVIEAQLIKLIESFLAPVEKAS